MKKNNKKISIIVPVYKVEKYLPRCLDSLVNQTMDDIEIICINDGSPDNSINILKDYQKKYKDKIVIIDKENEGVWRGRKDGVKKATGDFIGFVDSDDYVALDYCEKLYNAAIKNNADISVCGYERVDMDNGHVYSKEMCKPNRRPIDMNVNPEDLLTVNGAPWNKLYKAELLKNMANLKNVPRILDDMMFLLLIYINANKIVFIDDRLVYYMVRKDSIINNIKKEQIESTYASMKEIKKIYKKSTRANTLVPVLDSMAFVHLGVSLMFRLSYDKSGNLKDMIIENTRFLNENFQSWKNSEFLTLRYMFKNGFCNFKVWVVKKVYDLHLIRLFMMVYRFMIDKLGIDIKW